MRQIQVQTQQRSQMVDITAQVRRAVQEDGLKEGRVIVYVPHTTAGITINENADPDVVHDMLAQLDAMVPWSQPFYRHGEGNSAAHVKASMMGSSVTVLVHEGRLVLGTWQGIWFCEFDGPRRRNVLIHTSRED
ncbi:MAG TPA: secondary thiamine-phosphate synthase enzyme YjbQ [Phycisphaeraceae bacterium]